MNRMFTVLHTKGAIETAYLVSERSNVRALQAVLDHLYGFTSRDTVRGVCAASDCSITAEPWDLDGPMRLYSRNVGAKS